MAGCGTSRSAVLAQVRESDYVAQLDQARGRLAEAQQARDSAVSQLAEARAARQRAISQLAVAQAAYEKASLDMERARNLYGTQSLTKVDYDQAKAQFDETRAQMDVAKAQIAAAEASEQTAQSQIGVAAGRIATAKAGVDHGEIQLGDTALTAPMDALILKRNVEAGDFAQPGKVGFVLADVSSAKVVFGVPDVVLPSLAPGSLQTITAEAVPGVEFRGQITRVAPSADVKSRTFDVEVTVPNSGYRLKVGLIASIQLGAARPAAPVPVVPLNAIVRPKQDPAGYAVVVVEEQAGKPVARVRPITLGETYGNLIGVTQGVKVGERVVVTGATQVGDGDPVRVIP
jgi:RND family efflux transporter MFP subunit